LQNWRPEIGVLLAAVKRLFFFSNFIGDTRRITQNPVTYVSSGFNLVNACRLHNEQ